MHEILDLPDTNIYGIEFSDSLTEDDYDTFVSTLKQSLEQHTTTRFLCVLDGVEGWEPEEKWEQLAFDVRHVSDLDKVAIVGDDLWERWVDKVNLLFPASQIQTYDADDYDEALQWVRGGMEVPGLGPGSTPDPQAGPQDEEDE